MTSLNDFDLSVKLHHEKAGDQMLFARKKKRERIKTNAKWNAKLQNVVERPGRPQVTVGRMLRTMVHRNRFKLF